MTPVCWRQHSSNDESVPESRPAKNMSSWSSEPNAMGRNGKRLPRVPAGDRGGYRSPRHGGSSEEIRRKRKDDGCRVGRWVSVCFSFRFRTIFNLIFNYFCNLSLLKFLRYLSGNVIFVQRDPKIEAFSNNRPADMCMASL